MTIGSTSLVPRTLTKIILTVRPCLLSSLRTPLSPTNQPNLPSCAHYLTNFRSSAFRAQKCNLVYESVYKRPHLHARRFSTDRKSTAMSETVIREVAKDVWIFSK